MDSMQQPDSRPPQVGMHRRSRSESAAQTFSEIFAGPELLQATGLVTQFSGQAGAISDELLDVQVRVVGGRPYDEPLAIPASSLAMRRCGDAGAWRA